MDSKTLLKVLKIAVREVIKEELTDILREGLQSTITEIKQPSRSTNSMPTPKQPAQFNETRYAKILNETDPMEEHRPLAMNSFAELLNEGMDDTITMTSRDAQGFGMQRKNMQSGGGYSTPSVIQDPETGKTLEVPADIANAMTRDYSALMQAMNNKKAR